MGQPTNLLLGGQAGLLGADPELYRQQLLQQEQARVAAMPAQNQLAGTLGGLLGRGISNVAQDRGFFEVSNPVLQKLTSIQNVYNRAMQDSDPNDPLSFYKNLQTGFAGAGLGQQALMAGQEYRKAEELGLKTEAAKTDLYKKNPALLDTQIEKARNAGNDTLANQLAQQRGQIQVQIDLDRAKEVAQLALLGAQTDAQKAQAGKLSQDIETGKFDWKVINDITGAPTHMAKINKKTGETSYEPITLPGGAPASAKTGETPKGERKPLTDPSFNVQQPTPAAPAQAPSAPAPAVAAPVANVPALDPQTRIYYAARDPVLVAIKQAYAADPQRLATDPAYFQQLTKARNDQIAMLREKYGNMVSFEGL
jgi:hypothetical protein